jgi:aminoglycoside phosphotransferase (APT) family kinase protein
MDLTGAWLATLHTSHLPIEKTFKIENEIDNLHDWVELIGSKYAEEKAAAANIADYLLESVATLDLTNTSPIHKDFHYEHILVDGGLKVFDFDEIRLGDPNFDLAHFCANFYLLAYRNSKHTVQFSRLQNKFFESYARNTGWRLSKQFLFFYAYTCLKIAKQLCKKRGPRPWPEGEEQRAQVWLMLEQGLRTIAQAKAARVPGQASLPEVDFSRIRRSGWVKAERISRSDTSSAATHVSHKLLS